MFCSFKNEIHNSYAIRNGNHLWRNLQDGQENGVAISISVSQEWAQDDSFTSPECKLTTNQHFQTSDETVDPPVVCADMMLSHKPTRKRSRTKFTAYQLNRLEEAFMENNYVIGMKRRRLAAELCLQEKPVKTWFQNRRVKMKMELLKINQAMVIQPVSRSLAPHFQTKARYLSAYRIRQYI